MKPLAGRRSASGRSSVDERVEKISRLPREIDVRRWQALRAFLEATGKTLNRRRIALRKGHTTGNMVSHILAGRAAMTEVWMLFIAEDLNVAPQVIWGEDWPFSYLTPDYSDPVLLQVIRRWDALRSATRKKIIALAEAPRASR